MSLWSCTCGATNADLWSVCMVCDAPRRAVAVAALPASSPVRGAAVPRTLPLSPSPSSSHLRPTNRPFAGALDAAPVDPLVVTSATQHTVPPPVDVSPVAVVPASSNGRSPAVPPFDADQRPGHASPLPSVEELAAEITRLRAMVKRLEAQNSLANDTIHALSTELVREQKSVKIPDVLMDDMLHRAGLMLEEREMLLTWIRAFAQESTELRAVLGSIDRMDQAAAHAAVMKSDAVRRLLEERDAERNAVSTFRAAATEHQLVAEALAKELTELRSAKALHDIVSHAELARLRGELAAAAKENDVMRHRLLVAAAQQQGAASMGV